MVDDFKPPIRERTTDELLEIVGNDKNWKQKAVELAKKELDSRKVESKKIETAKYLSKKRNRIKANKKANEGYQLIDFILDPIPELIEIMFSWELKKDGYLRKAKQQKRFRITLGLTIIILFLFYKTA